LNFFEKIEEATVEMGAKTNSKTYFIKASLRFLRRFFAFGFKVFKMTQTNLFFKIIVCIKRPSILSQVQIRKKVSKTYYKNKNLTKNVMN